MQPFIRRMGAGICTIPYVVQEPSH